MEGTFLFNIAGGITSSVAGSLATGEFKPFRCFKEELEKLKNMVLTIKAVLMDAEEQQAESEAVRRWLERLSDILYVVDDLVDAISTEALRRKLMTGDKMAKKVCLFFSKSIQLAYDVRMTHKVKSIRGKLDAISIDMRIFQLASNLEDTANWVTRYYSAVPKEEVIGRKYDKQEVIKRLLDPDVKESVSVLPIVGKSGLGKTTLAQWVFNDQKIQNHFELRIWVEVSDSFNVKRIVENILEYLTKERSKPLEMNALISHLKERIDGKKYLLVLDDMWHEDFEDSEEYREHWSNLKRIIMGGAIGSRILITTREGVSDLIENPYVLQRLEDKDSWDLFTQMTFLNEKWLENPKLEKIGWEIVEKCDGFPLALKTMGRMLHFRETEWDWKNFVDKELSYIRQKKYTISSILESHYKEFPPLLKYCFVYCGLFPKNYKFDVSTLISLWIAQGFIESSSETQCLEDVGYNYFRYLLWSSFFQQPELDEFDKVIRCTMHNLVHDLAISMAGELICSHKKITINESTRHVANYSSAGQISLHKEKKIRTFLCLGVNKYFSAEIDCKAIFSTLKFLRVLDLSDKKLKCLPSSIDKLRHLRYLDLSGNNEIVKLPNSITKLYKLWTLKLSSCWLLKELPRDIRKLVNLRHLEINDCWGLRNMPKGLGKLTDLQTLSMFAISTDSCSKNTGGLDELGQLHNLRGHLRIQHLSHVKGIASKHEAANLKEKSRLCALDLNWSFEGDRNDSNISEDEEDKNNSNINEDEEEKENNLSLENLQPHSNLQQLCLKDYRGSRVSNWLLSLTCLVELKLLWCRKCQYLPPLSQLSSLKRLWLWNMDALHHISDFDNQNQFSSSSMLATFFKSLEEIWLNECPKLKEWGSINKSVEIIPSFPRLSKLKIENCPSLTLMPIFPCLEEELYLYKANWKPLQQTMMNTSVSPLSKLRRLELHSIEELEILPEEWLQNLSALKTLTIESCCQLKSLSPGIKHLSALEHLNLSFCAELEITNEECGMQWQDLKSLLSLSFKDLPKLICLPSGLQHATTLQNLEISYCESLTVIPEWIQDSESLEGLKIIHCSKLKYLPKRMRRKFIFEDAKDKEMSHLISKTGAEDE